MSPGHQPGRARYLDNNVIELGRGDDEGEVDDAGCSGSCTVSWCRELNEHHYGSAVRPTGLHHFGCGLLGDPHSVLALA